MHWFCLAPQTDAMLLLLLSLGGVPGFEAAAARCDTDSSNRRLKSA
jgi:hypothetical protein